MLNREYTVFITNYNNNIINKNLSNAIADQTSFAKGRSHLTTFQLPDKTITFYAIYNYQHKKRYDHQQIHYQYKNHQEKVPWNTHYPPRRLSNTHTRTRYTNPRHSTKHCTKTPHQHHHKHHTPNLPFNYPIPPPCNTISHTMKLKIR